MFDTKIIEILKSMSDERLEIYLKQLDPNYFLYKLALEEKRFRKSKKMDD